MCSKLKPNNLCPNFIIDLAYSDNYRKILQNTQKSRLIYVRLWNKSVCVVYKESSLTDCVILVWTQWEFIWDGKYLKKDLGLKKFLNLIELLRHTKCINRPSGTVCIKSLLTQGCQLNYWSRKFGTSVLIPIFSLYSD